MDSANSRRLYNIASAVLLAYAVGAWLQALWAAQRKPLLFDDAYMFARYAANIHHGLGLSWNLDGVPTYGPTSLLWTGVVTVLSLLPIGTWAMLTLGSWLCSIGAVIAMAWAVARNVDGGVFASTWRVLPLIVLPLTAAATFTGNQSTGMETMLATMLAALFVGLTLEWRSGRASSAAVGLTGLLLFMARPEAALAVVLFPAMLSLVGRTVPVRRSATMLGIFFAGVALELLFCRFYFHTPFPLSFYMKSRHAYEGYSEVWYPELQLMTFLTGCQLFLVAMILLVRRRDLRLVACCLVPAMAVFAYLQTVTQIMGFNARYYTPYLPFFIVPALLVVGRWLSPEEEPAEARWPGRSLLVRSCIAGASMLLFVAFSSESVQGKVRRMEARKHIEYEAAQLQTAATTSLPRQDWSTMMADVTDLLIAPLPAGSTVAATEVGYLGLRAARLNVIDLAGLNDNEIALHGYDPARLLARKPDLIWLPNTSYTYQRGMMMSDPNLLAQYDLYAGAANYGIAIRKDSPFHAQLERQLQAYWAAVYPGTEMSAYRVSAVQWGGRKFSVKDE